MFEYNIENYIYDAHFTIKLYTKESDGYKTIAEGFENKIIN